MDPWDRFELGPVEKNIETRVFFWEGKVVSSIFDPPPATVSEVLSSSIPLTVVV